MKLFSSKFFSIVVSFIVIFGSFFLPNNMIHSSAKNLSTIQVDKSGVNDLGAAIYEALEDVESYSATSAFEVYMEVEEDGVNYDMKITMDHDLEAVIGSNNSCHIVMTEGMSSDALGMPEGSYTVVNELCIITNGKKVSAYYKEDGEDWEAEDLDDDDSDLAEVQKYLSHIYSFEFFEKLADGSIDYTVDSDLLEVAADELYIMEMDLSGDDLKLAVETQFFLSGVFLEDEIDYDDITAHVTIYVNADTFLPSTVQIDMPEVGEQLVSSLIGSDDAGKVTCTLITDYTGFNEFDEIEAPDV